MRSRGRGQRRGRGGGARGQPGGHRVGGQDHGSVTGGSDVYKSANGDEVWQKTCTGPRKYAPHNVIRQQPGPTAYAVRQADTIINTFQLFFTPRMTGIILQMCEGERVFGQDWKEICEVELNAYTGILFLAGVYRSGGEATEELWDCNTGRQIFRAVMSRQRFHDIYKSNKI